MTAAVADTVLWPVLDAVRTSAAGQLGAIGRPVCEFVIYTADHPLPADDCDCTCDGAQGVGWVRLVSGTGIMPGTAMRAPESPCAGAGLLMTVELGVHRCAPTLADDARSVPSDVLEKFSANMTNDLSALHRAFVCSPWVEEIPWRITQLAPHGPNGGCAAAVCQAQLVRESCCPLLLTLTWAPHPTSAETVLLTVGGFGQYGAALDFGDGSPVDVVTEVGGLLHTYPRTGTYHVTVSDRMVPAVQTLITVTVGDAAPVVVLTDGDVARSMWLTLDEPASTTCTVDWGDGSAPAPVAGQSTATHTYGRVGSFTVTVTDLATRRAATAVAVITDVP